MHGHYCKTPQHVLAILRPKYKHPVGITLGFGVFLNFRVTVYKYFIEEQSYEDTMAFIVCISQAR